MTVVSEAHSMTKLDDIALDDPLDVFIVSQVEKGNFDSAADVVRAGLRLLQTQEAKLDFLRAALIEGEQSGPSSPFDVDAYIVSKKGTKPVEA